MTLLTLRKWALKQWDKVRHASTYVFNKSNIMPEFKEKFVTLFKESPHTYKKMTLIIGSLVITCGSIFGISKLYIHANTISYFNVYQNGALIGSVTNEQKVMDMIAAERKFIQKQKPELKMELETGEITYHADQAYKAVVEDDATLSKLKTFFTSYARGVEVVVGEKVVGVVKDKETANRVLNKVKNTYIPKQEKQAMEVKVASTQKTSVPKSTTKLESVSIKENVKQSSVSIDPSKVATEEELINRLTKGDAKHVSYKVKEGDSVWTIAKNHNISPQIIYGNNPGVEDSIINIDQELDLTVIRPAITVKTVETLKEQVTIEPQKIIKQDPKLQAGKKKVVQAGKEGSKEMSYRLVKENGYLMSEEWLGHKVLQQAIPEIIVQGTMVVSQGSGQFAWPVSSARISSSYGSRWGRMHKGVDLISSRKNILASDNGFVKLAGQNSGYGKCIIIDHKNGYETLYGHLSSLSVSKGDKVKKGQIIGVMGSTGDSTGTHLHFEVHKNGRIINPTHVLN